MAGEGLKKAAGGVLKQAVGKRDTKHGLLDLPVFDGAKRRKFCDGGAIRGLTRGKIV